MLPSSCYVTALRANRKSGFSMIDSLKLRITEKGEIGKRHAKEARGKRESHGLSLRGAQLIRAPAKAAEAVEHPGRCSCRFGTPTSVRIVS